MRSFLTSIIFYTRIPIKVKGEITAEDLGKATPYFPYIGLIFGAITFAVYWATSFFFDFGVAWILAIGAGFFVTGGFHEDGIADTADGIGGGWSPESILTIMKDSRVGTFASLCLWFILTTKWYALRSVSLYYSTADLLLIWMSIQVISRTWPLYFKTLLPYAAADALSKSKPIGIHKFGNKEWVIALIPAIACLFLLWNLDLRFQFFCSLIFPLLVVLFLRKKCSKWVGGYTGDILGAVQQGTELAIILAFLISWP